MHKSTVRIVSTYPSAGEGISHYTSFLINELGARDYSIDSTKVYFLKNKASTITWLGILWNRNTIVHVQYTPTGSGPCIYVYALLRSKKQKFIITSHEFPSTYGKHLPGIFRKFFYWFERALHNSANAVTVHTRQHRDELIELGVDASKIKILSFPVYPVLKKRTSEIRKPNHGIFFGRIAPKKGLNLLLDAISLLPEKITFSIIGPPALGCEKYAENLKQQVKKMALSDRISFIGFANDESVASYMYTALVAVFPYSYCTQSAALMTAIGHGVPYVASDLPAFKEAYALYRSGLLFESGNAQSLADTILQSIDPQTNERMFHEAAKARENFNWKTYTDALVKLYEN